MIARMASLCAAVGASLLLAACAPSVTRYAPLTDGRGYAEQAIAPDRWRVRFRGGPDASVETVELFMLHRAAELTVAQGGDHFVLTARQVTAEVLYDSAVAAPPLPGARRRSDVFLTTRLRPIQRFEASAEVVIGRGAPPPDPDAYDARAVLETLGPRVRGDAG